LSVKRREKAELTPEQWAVVRANLHIVDDVILRHFPKVAKTQIEYFRSLGIPGLEDAVRTFDPSKGQLRGYAWMRIRGAILDGLENEGSCATEALRKARLATEDFAACQKEGPPRQDDTEEQAAERFRGGLRGFAATWAIAWIFGGRGDDAEAPLRREARTRIEEEALAAVDTLPDRERQVLELRYRRGLSWAEIVRETGIPAGTLYAHHHAAVKRLADRMRAKRVDPGE
jgi:RNA polymerase sigma factor (sigma-70 family)